MTRIPVPTLVPGATALAPFVRPAIVLLAIALPAIAGCGPGKEERSSPPRPDTRAGATAPTLAMAQGMTVHGLEGDSAVVTLSDGRWDGPPSVDGGAVRPSVYLVPGFFLPWNADGTGPEEAVVLLGENSGGSGEYIYVAIVGLDGSRAVNRATALLGDRVQVVSVELSGTTLKLTVLRTGPEGALCCPDEVAKLAWEYRDGELVKLPETTPARPLTEDIMSGTEWILDRTVLGEGDADDGSIGGGPGSDGTPGSGAGHLPITLRYDAGRFQGNSGCNRYFAAVRPGEIPGEIAVGPVGGTRMACPDQAVNASETAYLARLGSVVKFGFSACRLMLLYEGEAGSGVLYYTRR